jgi:hypothetical protein
VPRAQMYPSAGTAALAAAMPAAVIEWRLHHATATTCARVTARPLQALHTMRAFLQSSSGARTHVKKPARAKIGRSPAIVFMVWVLCLIIVSKVVT